MNFSQIKEETSSKINDLKSQIKNIPEKKRRAIDQAEMDLLQIP